MSDDQTNLALQEFPPVSTGAWEETIRQDLKGQDYAKKLLWQTDEGIAVSPYYRAEDIEGLQIPDALPGEPPYIRGTRTGGDWQILERIESCAPARARTLAIEAIRAGADAVCFTCDGDIRTPDDVSALLKDLPVDSCTVHFAAGERAAGFLDLLAAAFERHQPAAAMCRSLDYDPLGDFDRAAAQLRRVRSMAPQFRPFTIHGHKFH